MTLTQIATCAIEFSIIASIFFKKAVRWKFVQNALLTHGPKVEKQIKTYLCDIANDLLMSLVLPDSDLYHVWSAFT